MSIPLDPRQVEYAFVRDWTVLHRQDAFNDQGDPFECIIVQINYDLLDDLRHLLVIKNMVHLFACPITATVTDINAIIQANWLTWVKADKLELSGYVMP